MNENLYQTQIIERSKMIDQATHLEDANCTGTASNPLCGDRISVELQLDGDIIKSIACHVRGCLLCKASSSILAEQAKGLSFDGLITLYSDVVNALNSSTDAPESFPEGYRLFFPVRSHKSRHSCVMLPFDAVIKAVSEYKTLSVANDRERSAP
jgi:nitrogen fixation protein NifU and related proteins